MAGMSRKEIDTVLKGLEAQGCELVPRKNGTVVRFPNGGHTSFHYSQSDTNDRKYSRALIRRNGLKWPLDGESRKKDIMAPAGRPRNEQKWAAIRATLAHREEQGYTTHQMALLRKETGESDAFLRRVLIEEGYSKDEATATWSKPSAGPVTVESKLVVPGYSTPFFEEPKIMPSKLTEAIKTAGQTTAATPVNVNPVSAPAPVKETDREFIDTHESWTIDINPSIKAQTVDDLLRIYAAAGLEMELRVWRKG